MAQRWNHDGCDRWPRIDTSPAAACTVVRARAKGGRGGEDEVRLAGQDGLWRERLGNASVGASASSVQIGEICPDNPSPGQCVTRQACNPHPPRDKHIPRHRPRHRSLRPAHCTRAAWTRRVASSSWSSAHIAMAELHNGQAGTRPRSRCSLPFWGNRNMYSQRGYPRLNCHWKSSRGDWP